MSANAITRGADLKPESRVSFYQKPDDARYGAEHDTEGEDQRVQELVQRLGIPIVLEIGCGLHNLRKLHPGWIGLDISVYALQRLEKGRRICADWGAGMPLRSGSIPFAVSIFTLEHVPDPERALEELDRVLAPGGMAYLKPAFNVPSWRADGLEYLDPVTLDRRRRWARRSLVVRRQPMWRFATRLFWTRLADELRLGWALRRGNALGLRWRPLTPYHGGFIGPDSDAVCMVDKAAVAVWFRSRGYSIVEGCGATTAMERLLAKHSALIVRKPERV